MNKSIAKNLMEKQRGLLVLPMAIFLLLAISAVVLVAGKSAIIEQRLAANTYRADQSFNAAEAGLNYGLRYLQANSTSLMANNATSLLSTQPSMTLANNASFTVTYSLLNSSDLTLVTVSSRGLSGDGSASRTVAQQIKLVSLVPNLPSAPLTAKGDVDLKGSADIINLSTSQTIDSGGSVSIIGSASTSTTSIGSSSAGLNSDVTVNNTSLASLSDEAFFAQYFSASSSVIQSSSDLSLSGGNNHNYSSELNGQTNKIIWLEQTSGTARINGSTVIGSPTAPVILIVDGDLKITGSTTIYGMVYVMGDYDGAGSLSINGFLVVNGDVDITGSASVTYNTSVASAINNMGTYAPVNGSWHDFEVN